MLLCRCVCVGVCVCVCVGVCVCVCVCVSMCLGVSNPITQPPVNYNSIPFATLVRYWTQVKAATTNGVADVSQCALLRVPPEFMDPTQPLLRQVTTMVLRHNMLVSLPVSMMCLSQLRTLDVSHNKLPELQSWIVDLPSLTSLDASYAHHNP
jgi:hypothetical protein